MRKVLYIIIVVGICGCNTYKNKEHYEVAIGDTFEIYYSTNSCCYYCVANNDTLKHIKLIEDKIVNKDKSDCDGCDYTAAFSFKAISKGVDTVSLKLLEANSSCLDTTVSSEKYIIDVK